MMRSKVMQEEMNLCLSGKTATQLWTRRRKAEHDQVFKDALLNLAQVYYSGMLDCCATLPDIPKRRAAWVGLWDAIGSTVRNYYVSATIDRTHVESLLKQHRSIYLRLSGERRSKIRHLEHKGLDVLQTVEGLIPAIKKRDLDLLLPIMSGGLEPAALLNCYLPFKQVVSARLSHSKESDRELQFAFPFDAAQVCGKKALLVEDVILSGFTVNCAAKNLKELNASQVLLSYVIRDEAYPDSLSGWHQIGYNLFEYS
jgi:hypothetical protein